MAFPQTSFSVQDALLTITNALPTQTNTVNSASIDLGVAANALTGTHSDLLINAPDGAALNTGQTLTFTIQDSADNSSFAAVAALPTYVVTGASNVVPTGSNRTFRLPPSIRRYVRVSCAASATAGTSASASFTAAVLT